MADYPSTDPVSPPSSHAIQIIYNRDFTGSPDDQPHRADSWEHNSTNILAYPVIGLPGISTLHLNNSVPTLTNPSAFQEYFSPQNKSGDGHIGIFRFGVWIKTQYPVPGKTAQAFALKWDWDALDARPDEHEGVFIKLTTEWQVVTLSDIGVDVRAGVRGAWAKINFGVFWFDNVGTEVILARPTCWFTPYHPEDTTPAEGDAKNVFSRRQSEY